MTVIAIVIFAAAVFFIINEYNKMKNNAIRNAVLNRLNSFNFNRQTVYQIRLDLTKKSIYVSDAVVIKHIDQEIYAARRSDLEFNIIHSNFAIPAYTY